MSTRAYRKIAHKIGPTGKRYRVLDVHPAEKTPAQMKLAENFHKKKAS